MKFTFSFFYLAVVLCFVSCSNKATESEPTEQTVTTESSAFAGDSSSTGLNETQFSAPANPGLQQTGTGGNMLPQTGSNQLQTTVSPQQGQKVVTAKGMNPAHGEPGHRCEIAVGAPLDSKPTTPGTPQVTTAPASSSPSNTSSPQTITMDPSSFLQPNSPAGAPSAFPAVSPAAPAGPTPAGMNPPHGEPGHDCAIAVGAPLKKKE